MSIESIAITDIRTDGGTQPRVELDRKTVEEYANDSRHGDVFPAVIVFLDDQDVYWLADGFHRLEAAKILKLDRIGAEVQRGSQRDAILYSCSANGAHGLRRSNADKRRAVERLLRDEEWRTWSDNEIARRCSVDNKTVGNIRRELILSSEIPKIDEKTVSRDGVEFTMNTSVIGPEKPADPPFHLRAPEPPLRPDDESWLRFYSRLQFHHPKETVFMAIGKNGAVWVAIGDRARRVAEQIGDQATQVSLPNAGTGSFYTPGLKLWMGDQKRIDRLERLIGPVYFYLEPSPEVKQIADQQLPTADINEYKLVRAEASVSPQASSVSGQVEQDNEALQVCPDCGSPTNPSDDGQQVCIQCGQIVEQPAADPSTLQLADPLDAETASDRDLARALSINVPDVAEDALLEMALQSIPDWFEGLRGLFERAGEAAADQLNLPAIQADPDLKSHYELIRAKANFMVRQLTISGDLVCQKAERLVTRTEQLTDIQTRLAAAKSQGDIREMASKLMALKVGEAEVDWEIVEAQQVLAEAEERLIQRSIEEADHAAAR